MVILDVEGLKRVLMALANWARTIGRSYEDPNHDFTRAMADVFFIEEVLGIAGSAEPGIRVRLIYENEALQIWCNLLAQVLGLPPIETPVESMAPQEAALKEMQLSDQLNERIVAAQGLLSREEWRRISDGGE